jgi:hypothetical protein
MTMNGKSSRRGLKGECIVTGSALRIRFGERTPWSRLVESCMTIRLIRKFCVNRTLSGHG